jgi:acetoin utilization deacetylase AcuC-like enzyme
LGDPQGGMRVTPAGYAHMTNAMMAVMRGRRVCALYEGGYFIESVEQGE